MLATGIDGVHAVRPDIVDFASVRKPTTAIIIVSVGIGSVYAALNDRPWQYFSLQLGQYIDFFGYYPGCTG
jgi:hypothetical protein